MPLTAPRAAPAVLPFAILVYREEVDEVGPVWFASSVFTPHTTHGDSPDDAIEAIGLTLEGSVTLAGAHGSGPIEWFARQRPSDPARADAFRALAAAGCAQVVSRQCPACLLALHVAVRAA
jgi:hypothetical protein